MASDQARRPILGDIVIYRSPYETEAGQDVLLPAVVVRTRATCVPEVVEQWGTAWGDDSPPNQDRPELARPEGVVPVLPDDLTVDLAVLGLAYEFRAYTVRSGPNRGEWCAKGADRGQ